MSLWPLFVFYNDQLSEFGGLVRPLPYSEREGMERVFSDEITQDLLQKRPALLLVLRPDSRVRVPRAAQRIDYLEYFSSDWRFRDFLLDYVEAPAVGPYRFLVRRTDDAGGRVQP